jgi:ABC-type lipoprotein release transport system permease subunit
MRSVYAIWRMMARRSLANWRLATTLALGVLVAATLLASAPIYARAMADLGLTFAIRDRLQTAPATQVTLRDLPIASEDGRRMQEAVGRRAEERIGWFTGDRERVAQGTRFLIATEGRPPEPRAPIAAPQFFTSAADHVRVLSGRLPRPQTGADGRRVIEFALSPRAAEAGGLAVGDRITLVERFDDCEREIPREDRPPPPPCTPKVGITYTLTAQIVGLIEPADPEEAFWVTRAAAFFDPYRLLPEAGPLLPALMDEATFFEGLGGVVPEYRATVDWNLFAEPSKLSRANFQRARDDIVALRDDLRAIDGFAYSPLEGVLGGFGRELKFQQAPLAILLLQIAGIALFYVGVIAAMVVERQADEIALLRSRGAGRLQVAGVYLLEGLTLGIPVVLLAPFLAAAATALMGRTPVFRRVTDGDPLPVRIGPEAFALAALGATLSLVMLIGPAFLAARQTGVTARRRRPDSTPFLRRYYLDLATVALAAVLLWELRERGSVFKPSATGGVSSDPLLLISPALLTLAAAALLLRFYPLLLRLAAAALGGIAGAPVVLGLWQVVRNPGQYTRLALLLMMAVAVGTFAASYSSTSERSFRDRASFESGVEVRATVGDNSESVGELAATLAQVPGVERASPVIRGSVFPATPGSDRRQITVLGLDPDAAADLLWFRRDLADESLPELMAHLRGPAPRGKPLPDMTAALTVWVNPTEARDNITMWVRIRDATGFTGMYELGKLDFVGWRQLRAPITGGLNPQLTPPLALVSVVMSEPSNLNVARTPPIFLDDIQAEAPSGAVMVEDFEGPLVWEAAPSRTPARGASLQDEFRVTSEQTHSGNEAGRFALRPGVTTGLRGIFVKDPAVPLPVVVNPEFIGVAGANVGQTVLLESGDALIPVTVRGVARLFPTITGGTPFMVVNRDHLAGWIAVFSDNALRRPDEAWFSLRPDAGRQATLRAMETSPVRLRNIVDRQAVLASINANPLIAAGGSGILVAAFVAVFALVAVALLVTLIASVQRRRTEFAVMRAMGVSRGQVFRLLAFEYALVAVLGLTAGVYLGLVVGRRMLSFLDVTERGDKVVPPFILQTNWLMVGAAGAAVALTFLLGMLLSSRVVRRQPAAQVLRQTE